MRRELIIIYNTKILGINMLFGHDNFGDLYKHTPKGRELARLKTNFDLLGVRAGKSRLKSDEIKKVIYYSAIGTLDDKNRCRSKELKKMIVSLKNRFINEPGDLKYNNQLEKFLSFSLAVSKEFVRTIVRDIIKKHKDKK